VSDLFRSSSSASAVGAHESHEDYTSPQQTNEEETDSDNLENEKKGIG
jgi:hypothetical protein